MSTNTTNTTTNRKNKTNLEVSWPKLSEFFTIDSLGEKNPDFVNITLRVRLNKAIEAGKVGVIGTKNTGKGRPKLVLAMRPVSQNVINAAKEANVTLDEESKLVVVMEVKASTTNTTPTSITNPIKTTQSISV